MAQYRGELIGFQNLSVLDWQAKSSLGESNVRFGGISITGTQGATAGLNLNITTASADNCAQVLQRLLTILFEKKPVS